MAYKKSGEGTSGERPSGFTPGFTVSVLASFQSSHGLFREFDPTAEIMSV
jgi:hypothetical protein